MRRFETEMATAEKTRAAARIAQALGNLAQTLDRVTMAGPLNSEQQTRIAIARFTASGLAGQFRAEVVRLAALVAAKDI